MSVRLWISFAIWCAWCAFLLFVALALFSCSLAPTEADNAQAPAESTRRWERQDSRSGLRTDRASDSPPPRGVQEGGTLAPSQNTHSRDAGEIRTTLPGSGARNPATLDSLATRHGATLHSAWKPLASLSRHSSAGGGQPDSAEPGEGGGKPPNILHQLDALASRASALEAGEYGCRPAAQRFLAAEDGLALARTRAEKRRAVAEWIDARHGLRGAVR
jgi:hypothetical protein